VHCDYSFKGLEQHIHPALDSVSLETIRRVFLGDYVAAYRERLTPGPDLDKAVKKYKSHHKIYDNEDELL